VDLSSTRREDRTFRLFGLPLPRKATIATVLVTLLIMVDFYYDGLNALLPHDTTGEFLRNKAVDRIFLYLMIPLLVILLVFRERPSTYGFAIGDWRRGLWLTLGACAVATPILFAAGHSPGMVEYYANHNQPLVELTATTALDLVGWEFLFRGFYLAALYPVTGPLAVVLQAVPFALAHLTKPPLETLSTIFGGTAFGWVAWRTRSFVYPFLIHLYIMLFTALVVTQLVR
jgi:membrane protease YdiL (CAAX protease family)